MHAHAHATITHSALSTEIMEVGTDQNPNAQWMNSRGMWLGYCLSVALLHFIILAIPVFTVAQAWTLTNIIYNLGSYIMFHYLKGTPYDTKDQGANRLLTNWEQIDYGEQYTATRNFLTAVPVVLFIIAGFFTVQSVNLTIMNILALIVGVVPKLPQLHGFRVFDINRY